MSVIITNVSTHNDLEGENLYVLRVNERIIASFRHIRSEGLAACLRRAAEAAEAAEAVDYEEPSHQIQREAHDRLMANK